MNGRTWCQPDTKNPQTVEDYEALSLSNLKAVDVLSEKSIADNAPLPSAAVTMLIARAQVYATLALAAATDNLTGESTVVTVRKEQQ